MTAMPASSVEEALSKVQFRRRLTVAAAAAFSAMLLLFVSSTWRATAPAIDACIRFAGVLLIAVGIAGRTWAAAYIGGRKKHALVQEGPYSLIRHPLYLFSVTAAAGIGALWGSVIVAFILVAITVLIFKPLSLKEEAFLKYRFGADYVAYANRVGRFYPNGIGWKCRTTPVNSAVVVRTFLQSCLFATAIPLASAIATAQEAGLLPVLARLP